MRAGALGLLRCDTLQPLRLNLQSRRILVGHLLELHQVVARSVDGADERVEFQLYGRHIPDLRVLNQDCDQEDHDRSRRTNDQPAWGGNTRRAGDLGVP